jgi:hypothetical protein
MLILLLIVLHACIALPTVHCLLLEPIDARFGSRPLPVEPIVAHSDLPVEPTVARPSCRMRTLKSRLPHPVDRFISLSDLRPPVDEPMAAHPDLRPCRMRTLQSRIPRPTLFSCLYTFRLAFIGFRLRSPPYRQLLRIEDAGDQRHWCASWKCANHESNR